RTLAHTVGATTWQRSRASASSFVCNVRSLRGRHIVIEVEVWLLFKTHRPTARLRPTEMSTIEVNKRRSTYSDKVSGTDSERQASVGFLGDIDSKSRGRAHCRTRSTMRTSLLFEPADPRFVASFIDRPPHAKVVSACGDDPEAAPLPLSAKTDDSRAVLALIGHFARANRHTLPLAAPRRDLLRALVFAACVKSERARGRLRRHHRRDAEKRK